MAIKSTQVPLGQRKIYSDEVKHKARQQLVSGQPLATVALELGLSKTTLLRWKRQVEGQPAINSSKQRFDGAFKARALLKLEKGQSLRQVGRAMGVSIPSLLQWKRDRSATRQQAVPSSTGNEVLSGLPYGNSFYGIAFQGQDEGQPVGLVTSTSGVVGTTRPRWQHQAGAQVLPTTTLDISVLGPPIEDQAKALALVESGTSIPQVSASFSLPSVQDRRGWLPQTVSGESSKIDGRRLYDDAFKAEALGQMHQGASVRQLARSLGVTEVTLHKWRKKALLLPEPTIGEPSTGPRTPLTNGWLTWNSSCGK